VLEKAGNQLVLSKNDERGEGCNLERELKGKEGMCMGSDLANNTQGETKKKDIAKQKRPLGVQFG